MSEADAPADVDEAAANEVRGEISVQLGDPPTSYVLRPSFEAITAIEKQTGKGLRRLFREIAGTVRRTGPDEYEEIDPPDASVRDMAIICAECIRAQGRATDEKKLAHVSIDRIAEMIYESPDGATGVQSLLAFLVGGAVCGDYNAAGELKAAR